MTIPESATCDTCDETAPGGGGMTYLRYSDARPPVSDNSDHAGFSSQPRHGAPIISYQHKAEEMACDDLTPFEQYAYIVLVWCLSIPLALVAVYLINWAVGVIDPAFPGFH